MCKLLSWEPFRSILYHSHNLNNYSGGEFHKLCLLKYEIDAIASI